MKPYVELVRSLPIPSAQQTHDFAHFITTMHSWYKHIPLVRCTPFVFFLDPNAGRSIVQVSRTGAGFVDNTEDNRGIHYNWQTTESYRRRFGHWNCDGPFGMSDMATRGPVTVDGGPIEGRVMAGDGTWVDVPDRLRELGTAYASALMYRSSWDEDPDLAEGSGVLRYGLHGGHVCAAR